MAKKSYRSSDQAECPVCGGIIWGRGQKVILEGARVTVCDNCAQYGKKVSTQTKKSKYSPKRSQFASQTEKKPIIKRKSSFSSKLIEDDIEIIPDYAKKIRDVRSAKNLNQDQFAQKLNEKPSLLRRIEAGKAKPTIKLAKKIEKVYGISLIKKSDSVVVDTKKYMKTTGGTSLGDIAFIKKKK